MNATKGLVQSQNRAINLHNASNVEIVDNRPQWMKEEDDLYFCLKNCKVAKFCTSYWGIDCVNKGGKKKPKFNEDKELLFFTN
ncbi:hypothetical protein IHV10_22215 [Fictibacillus sp. 5RED26]|uniref:hypothetical protein n=1 Tax=Fictibacillus sp. 5RED26 TaxID=2745876 RepID=UPI0018CCC11F|nr:hypothetical protein [Fictibacillus sp. 5RED26]MBH0159088.1 hypothetical protein [Fictibacillus sp. 5RED26]